MVRCSAATRTSNEASRRQPRPCGLAREPWSASWRRDDEGAWAAASRCRVGRHRRFEPSMTTRWAPRSSVMVCEPCSGRLPRRADDMAAARPARTVGQLPEPRARGRCALRARGVKGRERTVLMGVSSPHTGQRAHPLCCPVRRSTRMTVGALAGAALEPGTGRSQIKRWRLGSTSAKARARPGRAPPGTEPQRQRHQGTPCRSSGPDRASRRPGGRADQTPAALALG